MREHLHLPGKLDGKTWRYRNPVLANQRHHHAELELNLVTHGVGTYLLAHRKYSIRPGDMLWLFPAQEHVLIDQTSDFAMWIAVFRRRTVVRNVRDDEAARLLQTDPQGSCCRRLALGEHRRLAAAFADLHSAAEHVALFNAGLGYLLLRAWQSFATADEVPVHDVHPAVERAARLLTGDSSGALTLEDVAAQAGLSAGRLSRLFHAQTGMPMVQFRNRQRIARFLELYGAGHRTTLLDSALEAGFGSYPQFHRVFRQVLGYTPAEFRNAV